MVGASLADLVATLSASNIGLPYANSSVAYRDWMLRGIGTDREGNNQYPEDRIVTRRTDRVMYTPEQGMWLQKMVHVIKGTGDVED